MARVRRLERGWKVLIGMLVYLGIGAGLSMRLVAVSTPTSLSGELLSDFAVTVVFWPVFLLLYGLGPWK